MMPQVAQVNPGTEELMLAICIYAVIALVTTAIAVCVLIWIAGNEGRTPKLEQIWKTRNENKGKMVTLPLAAAIVLCLSLMLIFM